jgi:hypothetical protein
VKERVVAWTGQHRNSAGQEQASRRAERIVKLDTQGGKVDTPAASVLKRWFENVGHHEKKRTPTKLFTRFGQLVETLRAGRLPRGAVKLGPPPYCSSPFMKD